MLGYLPQVILIGLVSYDLVMTYHHRTRIRRVSLVNSAIGWVTILVLLFFGGFFNDFFR